MVLAGNVFLVLLVYAAFCWAARLLVAPAEKMVAWAVFTVPGVLWAVLDACDAVRPQARGRARLAAAGLGFLAALGIAAAAARF